VFTTLTKSYFILLITLCLTITAFKGKAQTPNNLYEQTSETAGLVIRYGQDIGAIKDFYSPYSVNEHAEYQYKIDVLNSPEQRKRLTEVNNDYLKQLDQTDFSALSIYGKVDYILLKKKINFELLGLKKEEEQYNQITKYISFADGIYALEQTRRRGTSRLL
jgi:hypothetical protein